MERPNYLIKITKPLMTLTLGPSPFERKPITPHAPSVEGPEEIEVSVFADATCRVKSDAKIAGAIGERAISLYGAFAKVDTITDNTDSDDA